MAEIPTPILTSHVMARSASEQQTVKCEDLTMSQSKNLVLDADSQIVIFDKARLDFLDIEGVTFELQRNRLVITVHS